MTVDRKAVATALVNERGGVVATGSVADDPAGYLELCRMWVRHGDPATVSVADDGEIRTLNVLSSAAGQLTVSVGPSDAADALDRAVDIAQQLAYGEISPRNGADPDVEVRRLTLAAHAMAVSGHAGRCAVVEVLRQCHPAALAAWDDPTEIAALEILRACPDPAEAIRLDPRQLSESMRDRVDPHRVATLAQTLSRAASDYNRKSAPETAACIAAAVESALACERACDSLARSLDGCLNEPLRRRAPRKTTTSELPQRRSASELAGAEGWIESRTGAHPVIPAPKLQPPPRVETTSGQMPVTPPTPPPTRGRKKSASDAARPPARTNRSSRSRVADDTPIAEGLPKMPEPPEFVEPVTTDMRPPAAPGPDMLSAPPIELPAELEDADDDLLIFSQARSAWFKGPAVDEPGKDWSTPADEGWRAAAAVASSDSPAGETTGSGLPRRVPQANLVPGSAILADAPPAPIVRDATTLASRTAGYFRGWSRARRETVRAGV
ncbi:MAG: hypothetical protein ACRDXX_20125 [Stackebrandtia sp.]